MTSSDGPERRHNQLLPSVAPSPEPVRAPPFAESRRALGDFYSANGVTFSNPTRAASANISLPFSRIRSSG